MRHFIGYLIAAVFFVGGFAICRFDWPAKSGPAIPCGGGQTVWHRTGPDQTDRTSVLLVVPRPAIDHIDGSRLEPRAAARGAIADPPRPFC
jgi:hypothetical protein